MYTTAWCGYCRRAKELLERRRVDFDEISLDGDPAFRDTLHERTGGWTVPQVVVDGRPIGGYRELALLERAGELERLRAA
jgi:glutaredoxin 3